MAQTLKIDPKARASYAGKKVIRALRWMVISGTATFALDVAKRLITDIGLSTTEALIINAVIDVAVFAIYQYNEGHN